MSEPDGRVLDEACVYGRAAGTELQLQIYRNRDDRDVLGRGLVMVHGGAWSANNRFTPAVLSRSLAELGFTVFSLEFRDGRNGKHPCAVQDITAGVRYVRSSAGAFGIDPGAIGMIGSSSGGHLAMMSAFRPDAAEHRGTEIEGGYQKADAVSAGVACVAALWPVSDPLRRFRHALQTNRPELVAAHRAYYTDEMHMRQASVPRLLDDGEFEALPPLLVVQPGADRNVPQDMTLDLLRAYQARDGDLRYLFYPGLPHAFAYRASPETTRLVGELGEFLRFWMDVVPR